MFGLSAAELEVVKILLPFIREVASWIMGKSEQKPAALAVLPTTMQSELALRRAEERAKHDAG